MFGESLGSVAGLGGGGLAVGGMMGLSAATTAYNIYQQERQYAYEKDLQKDIFHREDNAVQRRARDLERAGLSPVLAAGNGANSGAVVSTTAPHADDLSSKYASLISMSNEIATSKMQRKLMESQDTNTVSNTFLNLQKLTNEQKNNEKTQAEIDRIRLQNSIDEYNLDFFKKQPGGGMPTTMGDVGKNAGYMQSVIEALTDKVSQGSRNYDQNMGKVERKIEKTVKKVIKQPYVNDTYTPGY